MEFGKITRRAAVAGLAATFGVAGLPAFAQAKKGGVLNVAITGEPPTLDAHHSTAFIAQSVGWHIYEGLFTLDGKYNAVPMLAESVAFDEGRKTYVIKLRANVPFHDGSILNADDVVASLERWGRKSNYGRMMFTNVIGLKKVDGLTVEIALKEASPVVPMMLAFPNQQAAIYPKSVIEKFGDNEIRSYVGTGPFRFKEHVPDRHLVLSRFDKYAAATGVPDGMAGRREAHFDELRLVPTPEVSVRLDGVQTGIYDIAD